MKIRKTGREPVEFCLLCTGDVALRIKTGAEVIPYEYSGTM